jgi:hypothetical protein
LAQGNPSLFTPFMRQALLQPRFEAANELLGLILEEAAEISVTPFVELLQQPAGANPAHWARQLTALRILEGLKAEEELRAPNTMSYKKPQQIRQQARETKVS